MKLAVIPARGGSKRIPRKNVKVFCGKPMIAWSIEAAKASGCFDRIVVSTDDDEIADVARDYGAEVPFKRPVDLSNDYIGTAPVTAHAIRWVAEHSAPVEFACCIYATAPFLRVEDIQLGFGLLEESRADYAFSVTSYAFPIQRAIRITDNLRVEMFNPEHFKTRSQDLLEAWHDAGQFYWGRAEAWLADKPLFSQDAVPIMLPRYRVQDIDTQEDWEQAEWIFNAMIIQGKIGMTSQDIFKTEQEGFWAGEFGTEYIQRNQGDVLLASNLSFFVRALRTASRVESCLEFGANIGMNLKALNLLYPGMDAHGIEINAKAAHQLSEVVPPVNVYNTSILNFEPKRTWELVLIKGVLIHINPEALPQVYDKLVASVGRYLLVAEYYNPAPVAIPYRGHTDRLFKRDFAGELMERYPQLQLIDYGFVYRRDPKFPQDDITWFLMEKR